MLNPKVYEAILKVMQLSVQKDQTLIELLMSCAHQDYQEQNGGFREWGVQGSEATVGRKVKEVADVIPWEVARTLRYAGKNSVVKESVTSRDIQVIQDTLAKLEKLLGRISVIYEEEE